MTQTEGNEQVTIAICGLQTPLGLALRDALVRAGYEVHEIRDSDLKLTPPILGKRLSGAAGIVNLYGEPYVAKWTGRYEFDIYKSRLEALRALGTAIHYSAVKPKFFITMSNAMVYDQYEVHDEYSTAYGDTFMSEVARMETDETMKLSVKEPELRLVLLRMGYIMSQHGEAYPLIASLAKLGWGGRVDDGFQCLPMIHEVDAVRAILDIAEDDSANGIFNLTIPEMASMNELVDAFAQSTSKRQHRLPKFFIKMITGRAFDLLEQNCKVKPSRLLQKGFSFTYPTVKDIISNLQRS